MSASTDVIVPVKQASGRPWSMWGRQIAAILRLELRKNFMGKRAILIYLLAAVPVLLMAALSAEISGQQSRNNNIGEVNIIFSNLYEGLILRTIIFFGCACLYEPFVASLDRSLTITFFRLGQARCWCRASLSGTVARCIVSVDCGSPCFVCRVGLRGRSYY